MFLVLVYLLIVTSRALERSRVYYPNTILIKQAQPMAATSFGRPWLSEDWQWQGRSISYSEVANHFGHSRALGLYFWLKHLAQSGLLTRGLHVAILWYLIEGTINEPA